jgi:hypothetical protein
LLNASNCQRAPNDFSACETVSGDGGPLDAALSRILTKIAVGGL